MPGVGQCLVFVHQVQGAVFLAHVVNHAGHEVEGGVHTHLVQDGAQAVVGGAHLDGVVTHASAYAEQTQADKTCRDDKLDAPLFPSFGSAVALKRALQPVVVKVDEVSEEDNGCQEAADVDVVGTFARDHAGRSGAVFKPVEDGRVEQLGEIQKVGYVGRCCQKHDAVKHSEIIDDKPEQRLAVIAEQGRDAQHGERQDEHVACNDIVEPYAAYESRELKSEVIADIVRKLGTYAGP